MGVENGVDQVKVIHNASFYGYLMGACNMYDCFDEELAFDTEKALDSIDEAYSVFEKSVPGLCYLNEDFHTVVKSVILFSMKLSVEHASRGNLFDFLFKSKIPNWKEICGLSKEQLDALYKPEPLQLGFEQELIDANFKYYENMKELKRLYIEQYNDLRVLCKQDDENVRRMVADVLSRKDRYIKFCEMKTEPEYLNSLPIAEKYSIFAAYRFSNDKLGMEEIYQSSCLAFALNDVLAENEVKGDCIREMRRNISFGIGHSMFTGTMNYSKKDMMFKFTFQFSMKTAEYDFTEEICNQMVEETVLMANGKVNENDMRC